jgi:hypothetical protein
LCIGIVTDLLSKNLSHHSLCVDDWCDLRHRKTYDVVEKTEYRILSGILSEIINMTNYYVRREHRDVERHSRNAFIAFQILIYDVPYVALFA